MTTVGSTGPGILGGPIATHLVKTGHQVTGRKHSPARATVEVADGGQVASSAAKAARDAEAVITMQPGPPDTGARPGRRVRACQAWRPGHRHEHVEARHRNGDRGAHPGKELPTLDALVSDGGQGGSREPGPSQSATTPWHGRRSKRPARQCPRQTAGGSQTVKAANQAHRGRPD